MQLHTGGSMQMSSHLLGLDLGTGGTRAVLVAKDGRIAASATKDHQPFASPHPGWAPPLLDLLEAATQVAHTGDALGNEQRAGG
jgi:sugar (pentulose or hexulose) kinase